MSRLRIVDAKTLEKVLFYIGFEQVRQKGSHVFYRHPDGRTTTVPYHGSRLLARPLLREILRECEINVDEYNQILDLI
ncbi:MAG: type II toxin-antitoxin system HicA family toxin [Desulfobacteraceae bacterium]|nr:type II toxin-antitoxin system HicA family toxin [Desulfobacteraceae bacterium]